MDWFHEFYNRLNDAAAVQNVNSVLVAGGIWFSVFPLIKRLITSLKGRVIVVTIKGGDEVTDDGLASVGDRLSKHVFHLDDPSAREVREIDSWLAKVAGAPVKEKQNH